MILVLADSMNATKGNLFRFERVSIKNNWIRFGNSIPVVLGKNGLAWGIELDNEDTLTMPIKREGDGRSPAGVFTLSSAFGYSRVEKMKGLKIPYIHITEMLECVDDVNSEYYNKLILRDEVENVDWQSSEKMYFADIWYELGVVVDYNVNPIRKDCGSCIFIHNWSDPNETTAGCTETAPSDLKEIIYWLDSSKNPVLVQLSRQLFDKYKKSWGLPEVYQ